MLDTRDGYLDLDWKDNHYPGLGEDAAEYLSSGVTTELPYTVEARPPKNEDLPSVLQRFVQSILEYQSKWLGLRNMSPTAAFEIRRPHPGQIRLQYAAPTKRLERKIRSHLSNEIPRVELCEGMNGVPVSEGDTFGGALLTTGRGDWFPIKTGFDEPATNSLVSILHRHAMQDSRIIIQVLFKPVAGDPVRRWYWRKRGYQKRNYLKKEKEKLWHSINPTSREREQAKQVDRKIGSPRFHTSIRFLIIGAGEYTKSRVKELAGAFNVFENSETGQYFDTETIELYRENRFLDYADTFVAREFGNWSRSFQLTVEELAALVALPDKEQENLSYSQR